MSLCVCLLLTKTRCFNSINSSKLNSIPVLLWLACGFEQVERVSRTIRPHIIRNENTKQSFMLSLNCQIRNCWKSHWKLKFNRKLNASHFLMSRLVIPKVSRHRLVLLVSGLTSSYLHNAIADQVWAKFDFN